MASANTDGFRLVRCPKCLNVLPEPANVTVYKCGGCGTTLRAKIRASNGQHGPNKPVRQDSDNFSVATAASNGMPPQTKDQKSNITAIKNSSVDDAPSTEHDSNSTRIDNGNVIILDQNSAEVDNAEKVGFEGQDTNSGMEGPADLIHPKSNDTHTCREAECSTVERSPENSENFEAKEDGDTECRLNTSEQNTLPSERSIGAVSIPDPEHKGVDEAEHEANKKSYLVRVQSRSCDLRASINSLDFHSARTSLQSKSFRASEPLQSKIMNTVDELKGDLSELFNKPSDCQPSAHPPPPSKQNYTSRVAITSSAPLTAYHPVAKHSGYAARLTRSGQVASHGLPSQRYRRRRAYSCYHNEQMEMRSCHHECCRGCQPPCFRSWKHGTAMNKPPVSEIKRRRPPPRNHCRPVLRGAPFVVCSNCRELLQLPTDFSFPSKGTRRLQCGSCSEVLSYSYRDPSKKKLLSPFGDEYNTHDYEIDQVAEDHIAGFQQADPVSYSEEYGLSFGISHSTSTEDGQPLHVSRNSSFNTNDGKMARDGKLHRLMGYSSASELLRHSPDLFESFDRRTPNAKPVDRKGKGVWVADADDDSGERGNAVKKSKASSVGLPLQGILKKGIHGLESLKLR